VAVLIADGFDLAVLTAVRAALKVEGATMWLIAPRRGLVFPTGADRIAGTGGIMADHHLEGQRSTAFDAIFVCPGAASVLILREVLYKLLPSFPPALLTQPRTVEQFIGSVRHSAT
jgi:catalase